MREAPHPVAEPPRPFRAVASSAAEVDALCGRNLLARPLSRRDYRGCRANANRALQSTVQNAASYQSSDGAEPGKLALRYVSNLAPCALAARYMFHQMG